MEMAFHDGFVSEIVGRQVVVDDGGARPRSIGRVIDFLVSKPDDTFPRIDELILKTGQGTLLCHVADVIDVDAKGSIHLRHEPTETPAPENEALYLIRDLFDKQIVDVDDIGDVTEQR